MAKKHFFGQKFLWQANKNSFELKMPKFLENHVQTRLGMDFLFFNLRGYCTPGQFLDCFCIFLKNYNTLVTSKICFL